MWNKSNLKSNKISFGFQFVCRPGVIFISNHLFCIMPVYTAYTGKKNAQIGKTSACVFTIFISSQYLQPQPETFNVTGATKVSNIMSNVTTIIHHMSWPPSTNEKGSMVSNEWIRDPRQANEFLLPFQPNPSYLPPFILIFVNATETSKRIRSLTQI